MHTTFSLSLSFFSPFSIPISSGNVRPSILGNPRASEWTACNSDVVTSSVIELTRNRIITVMSSVCCLREGTNRQRERENSPELGH